MADHEPLRRDDETLAEGVVRLLTDRLGGHWQAHAAGGHVVLCHRHGDPLELHLATLLAATVAGVLSVDAVARHCCPHH